MCKIGQLKINYLQNINWITYEQQKQQMDN